VWLRGSTICRLTRGGFAGDCGAWSCVATAFNGRLERGLDGLGLSAAERRGVEAQRGKLVAATSYDVRVQRLIRESFVGSYRVGLWIAVGLSVCSAVSAAVLIEARPEPRRLG